MSDTAQEDLSVEDILSSIKNILVDDPDAPQENNPEQDTSKQEDVEPETVDDILNLDDSMIVDETKESSPEPAKEEAETLPETPAPAEKSEEKETAPEAEPIPEAPVSAEENKDQSADEALNLADSIDIEQTLKMAEDISFDDIPALEGLIKTEQPAEEEKAEENVNDETIDASANIINNFAKVFAEKRQEQSKSGSKSKSKKLEQTISSNFESPNITHLIEKTILEQVKVNMDSHFEQIASEIIAKQTREWLDDNLTSIVEKTVAKEIERVIAKVGS